MAGREDPLLELEELGPRGEHSISLSPQDLKERKAKVKQLEEIAEFSRKNDGRESKRYLERLARYNAAREDFLAHGGSYGSGCCCVIC
eukprot:SAG22_NODE_2564_length_2435_cov_3.836473_3_plen_88_part_00